MDSFLQSLSIIIPMLLGAVGIEMANNPPANPTTKNLYRATFFVLALSLVGVNGWQSSRNETQRRNAEHAANDAQQVTNGQLQYLKGQLTSIGQEVGIAADSPSKSGDMKQLSVAILKLAQGNGNVVPSPAPTSPFSDFSNVMLRDMTKSLVPRMIEQFHKWDFADAHLDGQRASATPSERVSIQEQRDKLRADYVVSSKQEIVEATALRLEILRRLGLPPNADDNPLQNVFQMRDGAVYLDNLSKRLSP